MKPHNLQIGDIVQFVHAASQVRLYGVVQQKTENYCQIHWCNVKKYDTLGLDSPLWQHIEMAERK